MSAAHCLRACTESAHQNTQNQRDVERALEKNGKEGRREVERGGRRGGEEERRRGGEEERRSDTSVASVHIFFLLPDISC